MHLETDVDVNTMFQKHKDNLIIHIFMYERLDLVEIMQPGENHKNYVDVLGLDA